MLEADPQVLVFRDVLLNHAYTTNLSVTNPLTAPVEFSLRPSSPRYTITPNRVALQAGQTTIVSVRLFLSHYPNYSKGVRGQDDTIHIKSAYFEQKVDVTFFLQSRDPASTSNSSSSTLQSRSPSPNRRVATGSISGSSSLDTITELQTQVRTKDVRIKQLEAIIGQLEGQHPSVREIVKNRVEQERIVFEEKSEKVRNYYY